MRSVVIMLTLLLLLPLFPMTVVAEANDAPEFEFSFPDTRRVRRLLANTLIPKVQFQDASVDEVFEFLEVESKRLDPKGAGIAVGLGITRYKEVAQAADDPFADGGDPFAEDPGTSDPFAGSSVRNALPLPRISINLVGLPLEDCLLAVANKIGARCEVEKYGINVRYSGECYCEFETRIYWKALPSISPENWRIYDQGKPVCTPASTKQLLVDLGIRFPEYTKITRSNNNRNALIVMNHPHEFPKLEYLLERLRHDAEQVRLELGLFEQIGPVVDSAIPASSRRLIARRELISAFAGAGMASGTSRNGSVRDRLALRPPMMLMRENVVEIGFDWWVEELEGKTVKARHHPRYGFRGMQFENEKEQVLKVGDHQKDERKLWLSARATLLDPAGNVVRPEVSVEAEEPVIDSTAVRKKAASIMIPRLVYNETPITEVIPDLERISRELDPEGVGVRIVDQVWDSRFQLSPENTVTMDFKNTPLSEALRIILRANTALSMEFHQGVILLQYYRGFKEDLMQFRTYAMPPRIAAVNPNLWTYFAKSGIPFPKGARLAYNTELRRLVAFNTTRNLNALDTQIEALWAARK